MTTTDKNKLIAEFIGAKESQYKNEYEMYNFVSCIEDGENEQHYFKPEDMRFHSSWDWLMPVVEKIESLSEVNYKIEISHYTYIDTLPTIIYRKGTKIENTYNAVVDFILWYNQNKS